MKKKYTSTLIIVVMMVVAGVGYYYYLSNKAPSVDATQQSVDNQELADLVSRDIENNYPKTPREVVKLYMRIAKQYYGSSVSEEQLEKLGRQARYLFDDELKSKQTEQEYINALKQDVSDYKNANRYISDFKLDSTSNINYQTLKDKKYSSIDTVFYLRENYNLVYSYTKFTLRQDNSGNWKILYWELTQPDSQS